MRHLILTVAALAVVAGPVRAEEKISVGSPVSSDGPRREGLFQGQREVSLDEFLRLGGHAERADRIAQRKSLRYALIGGGFLVMVGAIAVDRQTDVKRYTIIMGVAGAGMATTGWLLSSLVPHKHELRAIADDHNRRLQVTPVVTPSGAGLAVDGAF